ncbi:MAG: heme exporter protein CcmD [Pseudomonadales bacterium]|nr:heme exporter protein CcmD [Pseudomonadales bacterium]
MQFDSWNDFLAMGGHAQYVWVAYGSLAAFLLAYVGMLVRRRRAVIGELKWRAAADAHEEAK